VSFYIQNEPKNSPFYNNALKYKKVFIFSNSSERNVERVIKSLKDAVLIRKVVCVYGYVFWNSLFELFFGAKSSDEREQFDVL
jgi:hypothetical protein